jgi:outer membrane receptor protein involved in Fe transport
MIAVALAALCSLGVAQTQRVSGRVQDGAGRAAVGAKVVVKSAGWEIDAVSGAGGTFQVAYPDGSVGVTVRAGMQGMVSDAVAVPAAGGKDVELKLHPTAVQQQVTVTATRSDSVAMPATANTVYALSGEELTAYPAAALDDKLRQQAGFELYRRASSHIANPTSDGISLRGLGSTAASRTLVLEDSVPMNDPFGGWIHWDEIPAEALDAVTIATGGGSDLYGSSALGGVIDVLPARPEAGRVDASVVGGGQDTTSYGARADAGGKRLDGLLAADVFRTAGYVPTSPSVAGPVDVPANVHYQAGRAEGDWKDTAMGRTFLVGDVLNEARGNGTPLQTNGTRLWRYIAGDDWTEGTKLSGRARVFGSDEGYRQSFSSINATRTVETLTRLQHVRTQEIGGSTDASFALSPVAVVLGADVRDIRATDFETPISGGAVSGVADTSARQRFVGGFGEALAAHGGWSGALSLRLDAVGNIDTRVTTLPSSVTQPVATADRNEFIASPRFGLVRQLGADVAIHAAVFRAFRSPTMNELYRTGQVGQETTQANSQLESERATGWEVGAKFGTRSGSMMVEGTYFWTEINRPVSAVLVSQTATSILDKRENLGQILSQGTELHVEAKVHRGISATLGYQYAHAVVTEFSAQPTLVGNWIPQVPRQSVTAQLRMERAKLGEVTVAMRASGHAFDDSANTYVLGSFADLDVAARHDFGSRWSAMATLQNVLNQRPDVSRTPTLTLGSPFLAQGGVAFHWGGVVGH